MMIAETTNNNIHSGKIKLRSFLTSLYFAGDVKRYEKNKMKKIIILIFALLLPCIIHAQSITVKPQGNDPINKIVLKLNSDKYGMWVNGFHPIISLPANAKPEEVIAEAVKMVGFDAGHIKTYKIVEIRKVEFNAPNMRNCSAALIASDLGLKVLLFKFEKYENGSNWWTRWYDASE